MSETIKVDITALGDMATHLTALTHEFESIAAVIGGYQDAVGSAEIAHQLDEFAHNWSEKRKEIIRKMEEVAGYAASAASSYTTVEGDLACHYRGG